MSKKTMKMKRRKPLKRKQGGLWAVVIILFMLLCASMVWIGFQMSGENIPSFGTTLSNDTETGEVTDEVTDMKSAELIDGTDGDIDRPEPSFTVKETEESKVKDTKEPKAEDTQEPEEKETEKDTAEDTTAKETEAPEPPTGTVTQSGEWNLLLVNRWNPLPADFQPQLVAIKGGHQADARVVDALTAMLNDCRAAGLSPAICSSYRTLAHQTTNYHNQIQKYLNRGYDQAAAEAEASKWVAIPGTSEHHTGFAFDIVASYDWTLDETQANNPEQKWLIANCYKYGFILRYPDDKTAITGIYYEPWHYRYVGLEAAKEITERHITLEEYLGAN